MRFSFFILYLISFLNINTIHYIAKLIGKLAYRLAKSRRRIGEINLKLCFPNLTEQKRTKILKEAFYHAACMLLEYGICWYSKGERISNLVIYENRDYLDELLRNNEKVIILYPHFYALEIGAFKLVQDYHLISVYSRQKNEQFDQQILKKRLRFNNLYLINRTTGILKTIRQLIKTNASFLYLPDQDFGKKDSIFVPFFNIPTATTDGLSKIAKITKAKIVPLIPIRLNNGKFILKFYQAWDNFPSNDIIQDTTRMNVFIEDRIKEIPSQYFWMHKRFKTRPNNQESFY